MSFWGSLFGQRPTEWKPPVDDMNPWFSLNIAGERSGPDHGRERQRRIAAAAAGEIVTLTREPSNSFDENAVVVQLASGAIGYIPAEHSRWIAGEIDKGRRVEARIQWLTGGTEVKPARGVVLAVQISD